jgi:hypothetical protein
MHYKPAFIRLKTSNRRKYKDISPSDDEWNMAATVFQCLKKFYDLTELLSGTTYPTANLFYRGFCEIKELINKWCVSKDFIIREMAISMSEKFDKYWECSSTSLAVACFLDPRYKAKIVEFYMRKFYGDYYQVYVDEFISVLKKLYQFYATSRPSSSVNECSSQANPLVENEDSELDNFLAGWKNNTIKNELDKYMADDLLQQNPFDILAYWKNNTEKYPVLAQIARDMMSIQVSTVASESAFSGAGRIIDPYRNRLDPEMVQALVCTKDWLNAARKGSI